MNIPGVEIYFDDLAKKEIINYLSKENFNKKEYLKKDYENFKKYLQLNTYPKHMDYLNSDIAPDIIRFMKSSTDNVKNKSYYSFLKKIGEETIPYMSEEDEKLINNISELLPIVRLDEIIIIKQLLDTGHINFDDLTCYSEKVTKDTLEHAYKMLNKSNILKSGLLNVEYISKELREYLEDLVEFAITKYIVDFGEFDGTYKLMANYSVDQIMRLQLCDGLMQLKGTKFNSDGSTILFVCLKKDISKEERLNYKDKFISSKVFQWESENNTTFKNATGRKILSTKVVHLFIRKMKSQDGITLPYTYFGTGKFSNPRSTKNNNYDTLTLDVELDNEVDKEYYLEFEVPECAK